MNAVTTDIRNLAHDAGVPPAPPEAHPTAAHSTTEYLPLKRLVSSPFNVRRVAPTGIAELAANIERMGLIQNLLIHPMKVGAKKAQTFGVAAGERRRRALVLLAEQGRLPADYLVPCRIVTVEDAVLLSTAENEMREPMHPADQCEAYRVLVDAGRSIEDIAALYGIHPKTVVRRLKLARVSPKLVECFRKGEIGMEQMQALALTDNHAAQEAAWFDVSAWQRSPHYIREHFTRDEREFTNNRVAVFVGIDAFEAAGGTVRRDLFSDRDQAWYSDHALMTQLATERLNVIAAQIREEGWNWVECVIDFDYATRAQYLTIQPAQGEPTAEAADEVAAIEARLGEIAALQADDDTDDDTYTALEEESEQLAMRQDEISESFSFYETADKARGGVFVSLSHAGEVVVSRGWMKREDARADARTSGQQANPDPGRAAAAAQTNKPLHGEKLCARLTAHRTAIVRLELSRRPEVALVALLVRMIPDVFDLGTIGRGTDSPLVIASETASRKLMSAADDMGDSPAWQAFENDHQGWLNQLLPHRKNLSAWLFEQDGETLKNLFSFCVAATLDSVTTADKPHGVNVLADALGVDYRAYWHVTGASYLNHVPKARVVDVVGEGVSPEAAAPLEKLKKAEAVATAERLLQGSGWLPEVLRNRAHPDAAPLRSFDNEPESGPDDDPEAGEGDDDAE